MAWNASTLCKGVHTPAQVVALVMHTMRPVEVENTESGYRYVGDSDDTTNIFLYTPGGYCNLVFGLAIDIAAEARARVCSTGNARKPPPLYLYFYESIGYFQQEGWEDTSEEDEQRFQVLSLSDFYDKMLHGVERLYCNDTNDMYFPGMSMLMLRKSTY